MFRYLAKYLSFGRGRNPPQYLPWQHTCLLSLRVLGLLGLFRRQFREKGRKVEKVPFFEGKPSVKMHPGASKFFGLCLVCVQVGSNVHNYKKYFHGSMSYFPPTKTALLQLLLMYNGL